MEAHLNLRRETAGGNSSFRENGLLDGGGGLNSDVKHKAVILRGKMEREGSALERRAAASENQKDFSVWTTARKRTNFRARKEVGGLAPKYCQNAIWGRTK